MMQKISPAMAAYALGISPQFVRCLLQDGQDWGVARQSPNGFRNNYMIYPEKFKAYVGEQRYEEMMNAFTK